MHAMVTPHAGVWIETFPPSPTVFNALSRLMQACGLKLAINFQSILLTESRLMQACGLKQEYLAKLKKERQSRLMQACGLKLCKE